MPDWLPRAAAWPSRRGDEVAVVSGLLRKSASAVAAAIRGFPRCRPRLRQRSAACAGQLAGPSPGTPLGAGPVCRRRSPAARSAPARSRSRSSCRYPRRGNAGLAAQSMRNAAETGARRILQSEHPASDQGRRRQSARPRARRRQQAMDEGAEIIIGPLFAHTVRAVGLGRAPAQHSGDRVLDRRQRRRARRLSSELPAGVRRGADVGYAFSTGKRSFAGLIPDNAYGSVVEASFQRRCGAARRPRRRARTLPVREGQAGRGDTRVAQAARNADAVFIPDGPDTAPNVVLALKNAGVAKRSN